jgi:UDP-glucose 4-epimerase
MTLLCAGPPLVTGAAGFIGSHLVEALIGAGHRPLAVDTPRAWARSSNLSHRAGSFDQLALELTEGEIGVCLRAQRPATIFHLSGFASVPASVREPLHDYDRNTRATLHLLEAVRAESPGSRIVFTSSAAVYGEGQGVAFCEDDPVRPMAPYAVSKLAAEGYLALYARLFGLRTATVRLFPNYGPRLRAHVVYDLMVKIRDNPREVTIEGDGRQVRDFVYVSDTIDALMIVVAAAPMEGEIYNVGTGQPVTVTQIAELLAERMGASPRFAYTTAMAPGVSTSWIADIARLRRLGYFPRVGIAKGLARTVDWFERSEARVA